MSEKMSSMAGLFVAGTDTGVGKTRVTCWLARHLSHRKWKVGVCKPAVSGSVQIADDPIWEDVEQLRESVPTRWPTELVCPYRYHAPLAPPMAAKHEGLTIPPLPSYLQHFDRFKGLCDLLLVEAAGGLLCPLTEHETMAELAAEWGKPMLIVARNGLGTINSTLMTIECAERRNINVIGVMLNSPIPSRHDDPSEKLNRDEIARRVSVPVWGPISYADSRDDVPDAIQSIDWMSLIRRSH